VDLTFKPKRRDDIRSEDVQHETVLYDPGRGQAVYLNETAALVWKLCDGHRSVAEMAELLTREMADTTGGIAKDVADVVARFSEAKLVA
jgi:hypothetical protein